MSVLLVHTPAKVDKEALALLGLSLLRLDLVALRLALLKTSTEALGEVVAGQTQHFAELARDAIGLLGGKGLSIAVLGARWWRKCSLQFAECSTS